jgi:SAM-dependent methyltransferase
MKLLCLAQLLHLAHAAQPALRRRSLIAAAPLTLLRPAHAAERYIDQKVVAELGADGQPVAYETVRRLTGEGTGLDLSRNEDISERIFVDAANWPAAAPFSENDFKRLDENDDAQFYPAQQPRLVYHIDEGAVAALTAYYKREIKPGSDVLDICSSWVSHYPQNLRLGRVAGTGMNERELRANTQLTEFAQRDLNKVPQLPYKDRSFDVVTCVVSIDYLTQPIQILKEARRVLRPVWKSTRASGAPDNSSLSHFSAMTRPSWLGRVMGNRYCHAIEQASRRWRGGRRDDSAQTRRRILISTQVTTGRKGHPLAV